MKAIITIIILALVAWGVWWFARDNEVGIPATAGDEYGQVEGASDSSDNTLDEGEFDSKG